MRRAAFGWCSASMADPWSHSAAISAGPTWAETVPNAAASISWRLLGMVAKRFRAKWTRQTSTVNLFGSSGPESERAGPSHRFWAVTLLQVNGGRYAEISEAAPP
jgi:hypothetical protein